MKSLRLFEMGAATALTTLMALSASAANGQTLTAPGAVNPQIGLGAELLASTAVDDQQRRGRGTERRNTQQPERTNPRRQDERMRRAPDERRTDPRPEWRDRRGEPVRAQTEERRGETRRGNDRRTERQDTQRDERNRDYRDRQRNGTYVDRNRDSYRDRGNYRDQRDYRDQRADRRDQRQWDRRWRNDRRYDWQQYRSRYGNTYRIGRYYAPYRNHRYSRLRIGFHLGDGFYGNRYWVSDPWQYRLPEVYGPYRWVRYYDDVLLVNIYSGEVVDVIYDFFW